MRVCSVSRQNTSLATVKSGDPDSGGYGRIQHALDLDNQNRKSRIFQYSIFTCSVLKLTLPGAFRQRRTDELLSGKFKLTHSVKPHYNKVQHSIVYTILCIHSCQTWVIIKIVLAIAIVRGVSQQHQ